MCDLRLLRCQPSQNWSKESIQPIPSKPPFSVETEVILKVTWKCQGPNYTKILGGEKKKGLKRPKLVDPTS